MARETTDSSQHAATTMKVALSVQTGATVSARARALTTFIDADDDGNSSAAAAGRKAPKFLFFLVVWMSGGPRKKTEPPDNNGGV